MKYVVMWNQQNNMKITIPKGPSAIRVEATDSDDAIEQTCFDLMQIIVEQYEYMACNMSYNDGAYSIEITNKLEPNFHGTITDFVALESAF